jgi:hypothetical protein
LCSPTDRYLVALLMVGRRDFHFLRLDADGRWSHKPGDEEATREDRSGHRIRSALLFRKNAGDRFGLRYARRKRAERVGNRSRALFLRDAAHGRSADRTELIGLYWVTVDTVETVETALAGSQAGPRRR